MFTLGELKQMDRSGKMHLLVMGFMRRVASCVKSDDLLFREIPLEIAHLCTGYSALTVNLQIWDTMKQERWQALSALYYRDASAAMLVFDVTDRSSFEHLRRWYNELMMFAGPQETRITVVANKMDLSQQREVTDEEIRKYAESIQADMICTSAKTGYNITRLFRDIAYNIKLRAPENCQDTFKVITLGDMGVGKSCIISHSQSRGYWTHKEICVCLPMEHGEKEASTESECAYDYWSYFTAGMDSVKAVFSILRDRIYWR